MKAVRHSLVFLLLALISFVASAQQAPARVWSVVYKQLAPTEGPATTKTLIRPTDKVNWKFGDGWECGLRAEEADHTRQLMCRQCPSCGVMIQKLTCGHDVAFQLAETGQDGKTVRLSAVTASCAMAK